MDPELIREFLSNKFGHFAKQKPTAFGKQLVSGLDPTEQTGIDNLMIQQLDGIVNEWGWCKQKLGGNAILAVSLAVCKAGASVKKFPLYQHIVNLVGNKTLVLPVPAFNAINGGSQAGNKLAMQTLTSSKAPYVTSYAVGILTDDKVLRTWLLAQILSFMIAGGTVTALLIYHALKSSHFVVFISLVILINVYGAIGVLSSLTGTILIEQEWVVVISKMNSVI